MTSRVVLLPTLHDEALADFAANLSFSLSPQEVHLVGGVAHDLPENEWLAAVSLGIAKSQKAFQRLHLVAMGDAVLRLPAIAFAQRAARHSIASYVCVNQVPQGQLADWPDAPVSFVATDDLADLLNIARLRGWDILQTPHDELHQAVAEAIRNNTI